MQSQSGQVPCTYHPNVLTGLRCTRCGKPICPKDAVRTQVGLRCPDCAGTRKTSSIKTPTNDLTWALAAGIGVALLVAVLWRFLPAWGFYLSLAMGFGVTEVIARFTGNKRGIDLQIAAVLIISGGLILSRVLLAQRFGVSLDQVNQLDGRLIGQEIIETYGRPMSVAELLHIQFIPDVVYLALAYVIAVVRFR